MRSEIEAFVRDQDLGTFKVSKELPWADAAQPLYMKNLKTLYVDVAQFETETLAATLDGLNIQQEEITVSVMFGCDAKQLPNNYTNIVRQLLKANNIADIGPEWDRKVAHTTSYEADVLVTQVDYTFIKLLS